MSAFENQIDPGEIVALVASPPAAPARVAQRCRAASPTLLVVDATAPGAADDLAGLHRLPAGQRARLGIAVLVVTDDAAAVAALVDRVLDGGPVAPPVAGRGDRPLLLDEVDDDIVYFGVLEESPAPGPVARFFRRAVPQRLAAR